MLTESFFFLRQLGNNRGNKYSKKNVYCPPSSLEFWNFSIDEFAFHDIPTSIEYILGNTGQPSLSYIGFSQGTAQAFAALSIHPKLNQQVNVFIALAPAMSPPGLANGIADALIKASPQVLYLMFGRRGILSSTPLWESIMYPPLYIKIIDTGIRFLFNWKAANITIAQKLAAYPHLYSFTSTKSVVHWFQIIRTKSFQMYDDDPPLSFGNTTRFTKVAKYPTRNIKTPIVLVYGGSDSLVDIKAMLRELPRTTVATEIPHYEHLDFLWGRDVAAQVFPHVFDALDSFTDAEHSRDEYATYRRARTQSLSRSGTFYQNGGSGSSDANNDSDSANTTALGAAAEILRERRRQPHQAREGLFRGVQFSEDEGDASSTVASSTTTTCAGPGGYDYPLPSSQEERKGSFSAATVPASASGNSSPPSDLLIKPRTSSGSLRSAMRSGGPGARGIRLGASKAVGGVNTTDATSIGAATASSPQFSPDEGRHKGAAR